MPTAPRTFRQRERRREREQLRGNCCERGYDWHWMKISQTHRAEFPICQYCNEAAAVDVDHVIPFKGVNDPLRTDRSNLRSTCRACHNAKTRRQG